MSIVETREALEKIALAEAAEWNTQYPTTGKVHGLANISDNNPLNNALRMFLEQVAKETGLVLAFTQEGKSFGSWNGNFGNGGKLLIRVAFIMPGLAVPLIVSFNGKPIWDIDDEYKSASKSYILSFQGLYQAQKSLIDAWDGWIDDNSGRTFS